MSNKKIQDNLRDGLPYPYSEQDGIDFISGMLSANEDETFAFAVTLDDKVIAIDTFFTAILFCYIGYYNGCGKTLFVMLQGIVGAFCVRVPMVFLMSNLPNATLFHIGLATPGSSIVQIALCVIFMLYTARVEKKRDAW